MLGKFFSINKGLIFGLWDNEWYLENDKRIFIIISCSFRAHIIQVEIVAKMQEQAKNSNKKAHEKGKDLLYLLSFSRLHPLGFYPLTKNKPILILAILGEKNLLKGHLETPFLQNKTLTTTTKTTQMCGRSGFICGKFVMNKIFLLVFSRYWTGVKFLESKENTYPQMQI